MPMPSKLRALFERFIQLGIQLQVTLIQPMLRRFLAIDCSWTLTCPLCSAWSRLTSRWSTPLITLTTSASLGLPTGSSERARRDDLALEHSPKRLNLNFL